MKRLVACAALLALILVGCGGGSDDTDPLAGGNPDTGHQQHSDDAGGAPAATCSPSGTSLSIAAKDLAFDKKCLAVPANKEFTIAFDNKDNGIPHNVTIQASHTATTSFFSGDQITGPKTITYKVGALQPGTYHFHCIVHPDQMNGSFVVA